MNRRRDVRRGATLLAVLGLSGALIGVPAATADEGTAPATPLAWGECPADVPNDPPLLQCATVPVPLDYGDPDGERIEIMISRLPSFNPEQRRGILLLNPGGPGGSGLDLSTLLSSQGLPNSVLAGYDLIGVDPRGVGHSAPVSCGFTADDTDYFGNIPPYAVDEAAVAEQARIAQGVAEQCAANDVDGRLRHLSTANTARDLDSIRAALGEEKASFLGYSYGSALGAAYASMFPDTADRVVLDSNIGDTHLDYEGIRRFGLGLEEMFPDFADWAAARHDSYELGSTPEEVRETYFDIAERLDENPVEGVVDGTLFRLATFGGLYREASYGRTAQLWQSVSVSDPAAQDVLALLDADLPVLPSGPPTGASEPSAFDNSWSAFLAVTCNDAEWPEDVETYQRGVAEDREAYPLFGAAAANIMPCAYWQEPLEEPVEIESDGPTNVLIVQNQRDPATPSRGGELLDEKFGDRSRLVSVDGSGHGVYVLGDNPCALNVTTRFLVHGDLPEKNITCAADGTAG